MICTDGLGRRESIAELLKQSDQNFKEIETWQDFTLSDQKVCLISSPLHKGFFHDEFIVITENEIFPNFVKQIKKKIEIRALMKTGLLKISQS